MASLCISAPSLTWNKKHLDANLSGKPCVNCREKLSWRGRIEVQIHQKRTIWYHDNLQVTLQTRTAESHPPDMIMGRTTWRALNNHHQSSLFILWLYYCESQQSFVNLLTSLFSFSGCSSVCLSPWWHLHLSPSYDVLDHTNLIFSESLSSGDDNDQDGNGNPYSQSDSKNTVFFTTPLSLNIWVSHSLLIV